jgi:23S rRNA (cytosine1962-C5)-methyltransferase
VAVKKVILKKGKERSLEVNRHPWIFSGAIDSYSAGMQPGDQAFVYGSQGQFLAQAYFQMENSLCGRVLSFDQKPIEQVIREKIQNAWNLRLAIIDMSHTTCFRLINAEEDGLPGLIVDYYDKVLVLQISTSGMQKLCSCVVENLVQVIHPRSIYEKSTSRARAQEGLPPQEGLLYGEEVLEQTVLENGIPFVISVVDGQKTGFFLDQKEMRKKIGELSKGRKVLNCFSYSGGFSLYALHGKASHVTSVDICSKATSLCQKNSDMGNFSQEVHSIYQEDVFSFLQREEMSSYDLIILDPPAFAKKRQEVESATHGYRKINQAVLTTCKPGTILLTCSCSYFMDMGLFQQVLFQAASGAKREVKILSKHIQSLDHPISLYHPEGEYLKSLLLWVE